MLAIWLLILLILISLVILLKGADFLVDGSVDIAKYYRVPALMIGLTIVAFGTSLPEFIVSLIAGITKNPDISIGNIVGSNIVNIALIIGISAYITPLVVKKTTVEKEIPFMIWASVLFFILGYFNLAAKGGFSIDFVDGFILLFFFMIFLQYVFKSSKDSSEKKQKKRTNENSLIKNIVLIIIGLIMLVLGARLFVYASVDLAKKMGLSEAFIGLTLVAIGTSIPELVTSVVAAIKKHKDIAIGNIVGSNIFNILFVLGVSGLVNPIAINPSMLFIDTALMIIFSLLFYFFAYKNKTIDKKEGFFLIGLYIAYIIYLSIKG